MIKLSHADLTRLFLAKGGLLPDTQFDNLESAAQKMVGIHSARISTPFVSLHSRVKDFKMRDLYKATFQERRLIKLRCMRGTLHTVPLSIANIFHSATFARRQQSCLRTYLNLRATPEHIDVVEHAISKLMMEKAWPAADLWMVLTEKLPRIFRRYQLGLFRAVLKELWERGKVSQLNTACGLNKERRLYGLTRLLFPGAELDTSESDADHLVELLKRYFTTYGPATIKDAAWWVGESVTNIRKSIEKCNLVTCTVRGSESQLYCHASTFEMLSKVHNVGSSVILLAYEDPSLKAFFETRFRYVEREFNSLLFNAIGEARASILVNGRVRGIWAWDQKNQKIHWQMFAPLSRKLKDELTDQIRFLETAICELGASRSSSLAQ